MINMAYIQTHAQTKMLFVKYVLKFYWVWNSPHV